MVTLNYEGKFRLHQKAEKQPSSLGPCQKPYKLTNMAGSEICLTSGSKMDLHPSSQCPWVILNYEGKFSLH